jgi:hypothetical protein
MLHQMWSLTTRPTLHRSARTAARLGLLPGRSPRPTGSLMLDRAKLLPNLLDVELVLTADGPELSFDLPGRDPPLDGPVRDRQSLRQLSARHQLLVHARDARSIWEGQTPDVVR